LTEGEEREGGEKIKPSFFNWERSGRRGFQKKEKKKCSLIAEKKKKKENVRQMKERIAERGNKRKRARGTLKRKEKKG